MKSLIRLTNISAKYNDKIVLNNINYDFCEGIYIIQGENGGGKTTLLNILNGYLQPTSGKVERDENIRVNYLFQEYMLFYELTVRENFAIKGNALNVDSVELEKKINDLSVQFNLKSLLNQKISVLSGGEKQRVQLALLAFTKSDIYLLDEPIANLDEENSKELIKYILSLDCKLIIIVSHQKIETNQKYTQLLMKGGKLYEI